MLLLFFSHRFRNNNEMYIVSEVIDQHMHFNQ